MKQKVVDWVHPMSPLFGQSVEVTVAKSQASALLLIKTVMSWGRSSGTTSVFSNYPLN